MEKIIDRINKIDDFNDKIGEIVYDEINDAGNSTYEIGRSLSYLIRSCETERELDLVDRAVVAICGWSIDTLIDMIEERDKENYVWESIY